MLQEIKAILKIIVAWALRPVANTFTSKSETGSGFLHTNDANSSTDGNSGNTGLTVLRSDTGVGANYGIGTSGTNHGIWSNQLNGWMIHSNDNGKVYLNGDAVAFNEHGTQTQRSVLYTSGSVTVNAAQQYSLCSLTLPANKRYLLLSNTYSNSGASFEMYNEIAYSGTPSFWRHHATRVTTASGQGLSNWALCYTESGAVTVTLKCYGYYTTSHTESGIMVAIQL